MHEDCHDKNSSESSDIIKHDTTDNHPKGFIATFKSFSRHQINLFLCLVFLSTADSIGFSSIAPFFAIVATSKGLSELQIGIIFSSYSIAGMFAAVFIGSYVGKLGAKYCVVSGMFLGAGSTLCFGFILHTSPSSFFYLSVACRMLMGFGMNSSFTAMFSLIFNEFGSQSVTVLSMSESLLAIGGMLGPLIGGGLYDVGGYMLPFIVLGVSQFFITSACFYTLPNTSVERPKASVSPLYLLLSFSGLVCFLVVVSTFMFYGFLIAFLPTFLKKLLGYSVFQIAIMNVIGTLFYSITTLFWGNLNDKRPSLWIEEVGISGMAVGYFLIGPASVLKHFFHWSTQQSWLVYVSYVSIGIFFGATLVPTFRLTENAFKDLKLTDSDITKYGLMSGLWNTAFSIGDVSGPLLGGLMLHNLGFENTCAIFGLVLIALLLLNLLLRFVRSRKRSESEEDENTPLIT